MGAFLRRFTLRLAEVMAAESTTPSLLPRPKAHPPSPLSALPLSFPEQLFMSLNLYAKFESFCMSLSPSSKEPPPPKVMISPSFKTHFLRLTLFTNTPLRLLVSSTIHKKSPSLSTRFFSIIACFLEMMYSDTPLTTGSITTSTRLLWRPIVIRELAWPLPCRCITLGTALAAASSSGLSFRLRPRPGLRAIRMRCAPQSWHSSHSMSSACLRLARSSLVSRELPGPSSEDTAAPSASLVFFGGSSKTLFSLSLLASGSVMIGSLSFGRRGSAAVMATARLLSLSSIIFLFLALCFFFHLFREGNGAH